MDLEYKYNGLRSVDLDGVVQRYLYRKYWLFVCVLTLSLSLTLTLTLSQVE